MTSRNATLTECEHRALALYAETGDQATAAIAYGCSRQTLKNHLVSAYAKLEARSCIEAFTAMGWLKVDSAYESTLARRLRVYVG